VTKQGEKRSSGERKRETNEKESGSKKGEKPAACEKSITVFREKGVTNARSPDGRGGDAKVNGKD